MNDDPLADLPLLSRFRLPVALALATLAYGTLGYVLIERWSLLDAFYMTVITLTTVGFREVRPLDASGQLLTVSVILFGLVALLSAVSAGTQLLASGELGESLRRRRVHRRLDHLRDHFLICGFGRVGQAAAAEFEQDGVSYAVVDSDPAATAPLGARVPHVVADATEEAVLKAAGIERARGLICAVDSDAVNVYVTIAARALNPGLTNDARASRRESASTLRRAGADRVVSPYELSGSRMAFLSTRPAVVEFIDMVTLAPHLRLEEISVRAGSSLDSSLVGEVRAAHPGMTLLAVKKAGAELVASPVDATILERGDLVVVMGEAAALESMAR